MGARCDGCGGQVMPYRTYMLWLKSTAVCAACGARVRLRSFMGLALAGVGIGALAMYAILRFGSSGTMASWLLVLALIAFVADVASYHLLSWHPEHHDSEAPPES